MIRSTLSPNSVHDPSCYFCNGNLQQKEPFLWYGVWRLTLGQCDVKEITDRISLKSLETIEQRLFDIDSLLWLWRTGRLYVFLIIPGPIGGWGWGRVCGCPPPPPPPPPPPITKWFLRPWRFSIRMYSCIRLQNLKCCLSYLELRYEIH